MGDEHGSDRQSPKAEEAKEKNKKPQEAEPNVGTGDIPKPPPN